MPGIRLQIVILQVCGIEDIPILFKIYTSIQKESDIELQKCLQYHTVQVAYNSIPCVENKTIEPKR